MNPQELKEAYNEVVELDSEPLGAIVRRHGNKADYQALVKMLGRRYVKVE